MLLYVHFPFCKSKCAYCDFASFAHQEEGIPAYLQTLQEEITSVSRSLHSQYREAGQALPLVESVYIGGGTPSLLPEEGLLSLFSALRQAFPLKEGAEISAECNPGTLTRSWLSAARDAGINRLSMGVQSFDNGLLRSLGRIHTGEEALASLEAMGDMGFANISLDLLFGLPGQTVDALLSSVRQAIACQVPHLSLYSLIVEEGTPLARQIAEGQATLPDEDTTLRMQEEAQSLLFQAGLLPYEISNYAREGFRCRHNLGYWRRIPYVGLGCGAHSLLPTLSEDTYGLRCHNAPTLEGYLQRQWALAPETLTLEDALEEEILLGTRTTEGIDLSAFSARYGVDFLSRYGAAVQSLAQQGLAACTEGRFALTQKGLLLHNAAVYALLGL